MQGCAGLEHLDNFIFNTPHGRERRRRLHERCGVKEYWSANPDMRTAHYLISDTQSLYLGSKLDE